VEDVHDNGIFALDDWSSSFYQHHDVPAESFTVEVEVLKVPEVLLEALVEVEDVHVPCDFGFLLARHRHR